jgi:hypothetical protein
LTLSNWLRNYLYCSLPGLRSSRWHRYRNAAITALLGGLWHGASWSFVSWGALHGLAVGANHWWIARRRRLGRDPSHSVAVRLSCWMATYLFLCGTWVIFRSPSSLLAGTMLRKMAGLSPGGIEWSYSPLPMVLPIVIAGHAIGIAAARRGHPRRSKDPAARAGRLHLRARPSALRDSSALRGLRAAAVAGLHRRIPGRKLGTGAAAVRLHRLQSVIYFQF